LFDLLCSIWDAKYQGVGRIIDFRRKDDIQIDISKSCGRNRAGCSESESRLWRLCGLSL
jgi:hypothetical protein